MRLIRQKALYNGAHFFAKAGLRQRQQYNEMLRKEYAGREPLFDIAQIESALPDSSRVAFKKGEENYYGMAPEYTDDGGHLNEKGRKIFAEQLLIFLAALF